MQLARKREHTEPHENPYMLLLGCREGLVPGTSQLCLRHSAVQYSTIECVVHFSQRRKYAATHCPPKHSLHILLCEFPVHQRVLKKLFLEDGLVCRVFCSFPCVCVLVLPS
jgi:hypothetical protein